MESIWSESSRIREREPLRGDIQAEIAVIGAGIAGLLTASALQKAGRQVVVLEANRIASGQTRNTTAKITSQHGMIYRRLIDTMGKNSNLKSPAQPCGEAASGRGFERAGYPDVHSH